jgi:ATF/CREB family transcription factor
MQEEADDDEDQKMLDLAGHPGKDGVDGSDGKTGGKPETEEEKRKNFLERNRQGASRPGRLIPRVELTFSPRSLAALKCRQRKKAWLTQLQTKVDGLSEENERLKAMLTSITDEAQKLSAVLSSHRDCPGMAASMAQLGLTLPQMPMPPPPPPQSLQHMGQRGMSVAPPPPSMGMPFVPH